MNTESKISSTSGDITLTPLWDIPLMKWTSTSTPNTGRNSSEKGISTTDDSLETYVNESEMKSVHSYQSCTPETQLNQEDTNFQGSTTSKQTATNIEYIKRSFVRQKQVKELLNTECVYIQSLKVLKTTYLEGMMADLKTPLYFNKFRKTVSKLIITHQKFIDLATKAYMDWGRDANNSLSSIEGVTLESPTIEGFKPSFDETRYLVKIFSLISNEAINEDLYCAYCSLISRVTEFARNKNMEKYRRLSIQVLNDYIVKRKVNTNIDFNLSPTLDTRFGSLIQIPTSRITRYGLIVRSLVDKAQEDDISGQLTQRGEQAIDILADKCLSINACIGKAQEKQNAIELFETISNGCIDRLMRPLFTEDLGASEFVGGYGVVWLEDNRIFYDFLAIFIFDTHLIIGRMHQFGGLEVRFIIPFTAILNKFQSSEIKATRLFTHYPFQLQLEFEQNFKKYELFVLFPCYYERQIWITRLKEKTEKWHGKLIHKPYDYSELVAKSKDSLSEKLPFIFESYIPDTIDFYAQKSGIRTALMEQTHTFVVRHFLTRINSCNENEIKRSADEIKRITAILVHVKRDQRMTLERQLGDLWSKELPMYHLEGGLLGRSTSARNLKRIISAETQSIFSKFSLEAKKPIEKSSVREISTRFRQVKNAMKTHPSMMLCRSSGSLRKKIRRQEDSLDNQQQRSWFRFFRS